MEREDSDWSWWRVDSANIYEPCCISRALVKDSDSRDSSESEHKAVGSTVNSIFILDLSNIHILDSYRWFCFTVVIS